MGCGAAGGALVSIRAGIVGEDPHWLSLTSHARASSASAHHLPDADQGPPRDSCVRQVQQIGHGDRVLVRFQVKIGIPLFDLE
jgi:hypothetical protein